jgi:CSLREA domain-containing protein
MMTAIRTLAALGIALAAAVPAGAKTFLVDTTTDGLDASPGDGICADGQGHCTLRAAVLEANAWPGADMIILTRYDAPYVLTRPGVEDLGTQGDLDLTGELTITFNLRFAGPPPPVIVDGMQRDRVFDVLPGATVTIQNIWIQNGHSPQWGGGIRNRGTLTLDRVKVRFNDALRGGGIANMGTLNLVESRVFWNEAEESGGGIRNGHQLFVNRSEISENATDGAGGGMDGGAWVYLLNSTVSGNIALEEGDGILVRAGASVRLESCTVADHEIGIHAFGLVDERWDDPSRPGDDDTGTVYLRNTIVAQNVRDCLTGPGGLIVSWGHNLDSDRTCSLDQATDRPGLDPLLYPLSFFATNAARLHTYPPYSPAVDAGDDAHCPALDQRRYLRPGGAGCDIGAYEFGATAPY